MDYIRKFGIPTNLTCIPAFHITLAAIAFILERRSNTSHASALSTKHKLFAYTSLNRLIGDAATVFDDTTLAGVVTVFSGAFIFESGNDAHIHSHALAQILRRRGGLKSFGSSSSFDCHIIFIGIYRAHGLMAYLDFPKMVTAAELEELWDDCKVFLETLRQLSVFTEARQQLLESMKERANEPQLLHDLDPDICLLLQGDSLARGGRIQESWQVFCLLYLLLTSYQYQANLRRYNDFVDALNIEKEELSKRPMFSPTDLAWIFVRGNLDGEHARKTIALQLLKVYHRLRNESQSTIKEWLLTSITSGSGERSGARLTDDSLKSLFEEAWTNRSTTTTKSSLAR